ncbi:oxytocin receptor-like [Palaemon carinicauda]|uniref:oxytocin receptor-like n=1 Tax=Palaemon carinicauda TaxID=392227 RepID=UPI0035B64831
MNESNHQFLSANQTLDDFSRPSGFLTNDSSVSNIPAGARIIEYSTTWTPSELQHVITLAVLMSLSLIGNVLIILVLACSRYRRSHTRVNIFILHLAIGDLAVCGITMTGEIFFVVFREWVLGSVGCKIVTYFGIVTLSATIFLLLVMSWDRYTAICHPLNFVSSIRRSKKLIACAWFGAFIMAVPHLFIFVQVLEGYHPDGSPVYSCRSKGYTYEWQRKMMFTWLTFYILVLPSILITAWYISIVRVVFRHGSNNQKMDTQGGVAYLRKSGNSLESILRAKIRTVKMTLSIIITFLACWTPYFVVHNIRIWSDYRYDISRPVIVFAETMALANSVVNPLLYGCFNLRIAQEMKTFCCKYKSHRAIRINSVYQSSGTRSGSTAMVRYNSSHNAVRIRFAHNRQASQNHHLHTARRPLHYTYTGYYAAGHTLRSEGIIRWRDPPIDVTMARRTNSCSFCSSCVSSEIRSPVTYP